MAHLARHLFHHNLKVLPGLILPMPWFVQSISRNRGSCDKLPTMSLLHGQNQFRYVKRQMHYQTVKSCQLSTDCNPEFEGIFFRQLFEHKSFTYTYILGDVQSKKCILIDPVLETIERDLRIIKDLGLDLIYGVNTHCHADHITSTGKIKARLPTCRSMISKESGAKADILLQAGDMIEFGKEKIECRNTPGHTDGCMTFLWRDRKIAFTGDALLIRGCGRTDFQQGNSGTLYDSVHNEIFTLPDNYLLYPAHDYTGQSVTTVSEEKRFNPRMTKSKTEFVQYMSTLQLPYPAQIDKALPANLVCGILDPEDVKKAS